jgi:ABC-type lipoprotein release transport system permease subunit
VIARVPGIGSVDPAVVATLAIVGVALAATWVLAARAARIDPAATLRSE